MRKPTPITCWACGRQRRVPEEGRFVDGSWPSDSPLLPHTRRRRRWVCGWNCYTKLHEIYVEKRQ
jgi:hypothetical protein